MAYADCIKSVRDAAPDLSDEEAQDLLGYVADIAEQKRQDNKVADLNAELTQLIEKRAADEERAALVEKRNAALSRLTRLRLRRQVTGLLNDGRAKDIPDYLESLTVGIAGDSPFKASVERSKRALEADAHRVFMKALKERGIARNDAIAMLRSRDASRVLYREADLPGSTGDKMAKGVAEAMEETQEYLRREANRTGADIGKVPGYLVKQAHNADRMTRAGKDQWIDDILPLLDEDRTFGGPLSDKAKRDFLGAAFDNIILGRPADIVADLSSPPGFKGPGNMGKRLSQRRSLHFRRDGESTWTYMQQYGTRDIGTAFEFGVDGMSRATAAMVHLGPNPEHMLRETLDFAKNQLRDNIPVHKEIENRETKILDLYREVVGTGGGMMPSASTFRGKLARFSNWTKNITGSAVLGGVTLASVGDAGIAASRLTKIGVPFLEAHASVIGGVVRGRGSGKTREIADSLGVGMEGLMSTIQARWMGNDGESGQGAFLVSSVMRVTGMNWLNDSFKTAVGLSLSNFVAKNADNAFDALPGDLTREMSAFGIDAAAWEKIRVAADEADGRPFINPDRIEDATAQRQFREFVVGFADSAILTPGARTQRITRFGGERGEFMTEVAVLFMHLKSFSMAYLNEIVSRMYRRDEGIQFGFAAHLTLSSFVYGYLAALLKDVAQGKEPRDPSKPATWADAWLTSGGAGFYGDMLFTLFDDKKIPGRGLFEGGGGPGLGLIFRGVNTVREIAEGDETGAAVSASRMAKSMIPGANVFYSRLAMDYLLWWQMAEYLNPGFARRYEQRVREDTGQEYFVRPVEAVR